MENNWIDNLARAFATQGTRRQIVRGFLAAATGGTLGGTQSALAQSAPVTPDGAANPLWLPVVQGGAGSPLCTVASTCDNKNYCSDSQTCRCLMSAEGVIRCGQIPGCNVPLCQTSADCAHLGEGYFCDTPYSGCCADGELARCIAPCDDELENCPEERRCGYSCCPAGEICFNDACRPADFGPMTGTWVGSLTFGSESVGVRFLLQEIDGSLEGQMYYIDPVSNAQQTAGTLEGYVSYDSVSLQSSADSSLDGLLGDDGSSIEGTYFIPAYNDEGAFEANIALSRTQAGAAASALATNAY